MIKREIRELLLTTAALTIAVAPSLAQNRTDADVAAQFGAQQLLANVELSPDGKRIVYIAPGPGASNLAGVIDIATGTAAPIGVADGHPLRLVHCGWAAADRLVCIQSGSLADGAKVVGYSRVVGIDANGRNLVALGERNTDSQLYARQFDGYVLDWLDGAEGKVLMVRSSVPESSTGHLMARTDEGNAVVSVDTRNNRATAVEPARLNTGYLADGHGNVRLMVHAQVKRDQLLSGVEEYYYRKPGEREWRELGNNDKAGGKLELLAVDGGANVAYVLRDLDGRRALYRIALDGSLKSELVFAHPQVDVRRVVTVGRGNRVIGAYYETDKPQIEYFDPVYRSLAASISRALPRLPLVSVISASADEQVLLIYAGSDTDPGRYYVFNRGSKQLSEVMSVRPQLDKTTLSPVRSVSYTAEDGTQIPAYLTLPPGIDKAQALPAIVMPHGGPAARDVWGFDWLAQYFANRGFAVLQPNFRGSAGFGNDWFVKNGFQNWQTAIGDVVAGGRWLVSQGMADPARLAIVGWSYGGYAALQANVLDPDLFKAVVAIAPVTDLQILKEQTAAFTNALIEHDFIGSGPHIEAGSPARHAELFKAPVRMFHGDTDANVSVAESRAMDKALHKAGKSSELTVYPKLDHQLYDDTVRADMLRRSYEFLRVNLKL